jgi:ABC-type cobalamin/Fe3+-siderophores transport system ATPase subunit
MTTHDAAAALADAMDLAPSDRDALYAWLTQRFTHGAHPLVLELAAGERDMDSARRALIREARVYLANVPGAVLDAVRQATPPRRAA